MRKQSISDSSGNKISDYIFEYNAQGDQSKVINKDYKLKKTFVNTFDRKYANHLLKSEISNLLPFQTIFEYNVAGQKIRSIIYLNSDTSNSTKREAIYKYNDRSMLVMIQENYIENGKTMPCPYGKTEYKYNPVSGRLISIHRENGAIYRYSYNQKGLLQTQSMDMGKEFSNLKMHDKYIYKFRN